MNTSPLKPHFFKPLLPGFENGLKIPTFFYKYVLGHAERCVGEALLKKNGKEWRVRVENGHFVGDRWRRFSEENNLEACGFVIFQHLGKMVFEALVFDGITQCRKEHGERKPSRKSRFEASSSKGVEREIPWEVIKAMKRPNTQDESEYDGRPDFASTGTAVKKLKGDTFVSNDPPYYTSTIKRYCISYGYFNIPMYFARRNGFSGKREMIIMDKMGRRWPAHLRGIHSHLRIVGGWINFRDGNGIKEGDAFRFEIVENGKVPVVSFTV